MTKRLIKFRVWSSETDHYVLTESGMKPCPNGTYVSPSRIELNENGELYDIHGLDDKLTYEQFTGLLDKNGKEIYEGDIIEHVVPDYYYGAGDKVHGIVRGGPWAFSIEPIDYHGLLMCMGDKYTYSGPNPTESIVVGNLHENPELLS